VARLVEKAYRKLASLERPDYREPKPLEEALKAFKAAKEDIGHGTKRNYRRVLDNFVALQKPLIFPNLTTLVTADRIYLHSMKSGKALFLPIPELLRTALDALPEPKGTVGRSKYFFGAATARHVR
jgi:hypothetical protein